MHERGNYEKYDAAPSGDGCLTAAIRLPVRIVALVILLPVRMAWDALTAVGRALNRYALAPVGRSSVPMRKQSRKRCARRRRRRADEAATKRQCVDVSAQAGRARTNSGNMACA